MMQMALHLSALQARLIAAWRSCSQLAAEHHALQANSTSFGQQLAVTGRNISLQPSAMRSRLAAARRRLA